MKDPKRLWISTQIFIHKHERVFLPLFLFLGFIVDTLTLTRVDKIFDNILLSFYILLLAVTILLTYSKERLYHSKLYIKYNTWLPYIMQYAFGGLFSGLVIFYSKSASIFTSFPFLIILVTLLIGNEFFNKKWPKITFQILMFYIALLSYCILIVPIILNTINMGTFLLGNILSLILISIYIFILNIYIPKYFKAHKKMVTNIVVSVFVLFNIMYFANIIPPIPLSLQDGGIYHSVIKNDTGDYIVQDEDRSILSFFRSFNPIFHRVSGETIYAFSSVFAPTDFKNTIYHEWSYYDKIKKDWIQTDRVPIKLSGGREKGFRGYSFKNALTEGLWKVTIETESGQRIGRLNFTIENSLTRPKLKREVY